jgi:Flp pilus assembly protein TadG
MSTRTLLRRAASANGQSMVEFALVLPLVLMLVLGVVELSYALLHEHVVTKLAREGSNLISRDTSLLDAASAMQAMSSAPVNFNSGSRLIFSVVKKGTSTGTSNFGKDILYQRYSYGTLSASSHLNTAGSGSFGPAPDFQANNSDSDTSLQVTNLPANLLGPGGWVYITEIFTNHPSITPLNQILVFSRLGAIAMPSTLYSIAYF